MKFVEKLRQRNACRDAVEWVGDQTLAQAWASCTRPDWMLWLLGVAGLKREVQTLACVFAQDALDAHWTDTTDTRPQEAIMAALLAIEAPSEETRSAAGEAENAARCAAWSAAASAAWSAEGAAWSAEGAAWSARSAEGAAASAWSAAWSAESAEGAAASAESAARARQVEQIRSMVSAERIRGLL